MKESYDQVKLIFDLTELIQTRSRSFLTVSCRFCNISQLGHHLSKSFKDIICLNPRSPATAAFSAFRALCSDASVRSPSVQMRARE
jgi:hypothetical protein